MDRLSNVNFAKGQQKAIGMGKARQGGVSNNRKLWTGKTAKQELFQSVTIAASVHGFTIGEALEYALDGAEQCPMSSPKREMLTWWEKTSSAAQARFLGQARTEAKRVDRLYGRTLYR